MPRAMIVAAALAGLSTAAGAATLDFSELGSGQIFDTGVSITGADLTSGGTGFEIDPIFANSICVIGVNGCANDLGIDFTEAVTDISFEVSGFQPGDAVVVLILDPAAVLLGTVDIVGDGLYALTGFGVIGSLLFDDSSDTFGVAYGTVTFEVAARVPLPATLPLLLAGLGALGTSLRRRGSRSARRPHPRCDGCQNVTHRSSAVMTP